jgi:periplasmic copper chaperone A
MKILVSLKTFASMAVISAGLFAVPALAEVVGREGWSRATPPGAKEAVGYLVLENKGDVERSLMKITSDLADEVRIHRSSVDSQGVARMWPVGFLKLQPGETVRFEPNGLHVMLSALKKPLKAGDKVALTMLFDGFLQPFTVMLEVRPLVPAAAPDQSQHKH